MGKTLRAFAPTLQELTSVSRDLKNTLDNELGIDEIRRDFASAQVRSYNLGGHRIRAGLKCRRNMGTHCRCRPERQVFLHVPAEARDLTPLCIMP